MHGRGMCGRGGMHGGGVHGRGILGRGHAWQGVCVAGETATAADGTHPTGMHSYSAYGYKGPLVNKIKSARLLDVLTGRSSQLQTCESRETFESFTTTNYPHHLICGEI